MRGKAVLFGAAADIAEGTTSTVTSCGRPVARLMPLDRAHGQRSIEQLLTFIEDLPIRPSGDWTRADLYE
jgi:antitoxin (DNA-binding transcriptional repressor) of toxin-antitoxin stability system